MEDKHATPRVSLIVAASDNHIIGNKGDLPWRMPADLQHFKRLTMGHCLIMGRKTYESIGRPLPGRTTIVLSRSNNTAYAEGVRTVSSFEAAVSVSQTITERERSEVFVTGGGEIYRLALSNADRIYLTRVHTNVEGDARFPEIDSEQWILTSQEARSADEKNEHDCTFEIYDRR